MLDKIIAIIVLVVILGFLYIASIVLDSVNNFEVIQTTEQINK